MSSSDPQKRGQGCLQSTDSSGRFCFVWLPLLPFFHVCYFISLQIIDQESTAEKHNEISENIIAVAVKTMVYYSYLRPSGGPMLNYSYYVVLVALQQCLLKMIVNAVRRLVELPLRPRSP